MAQSSEVLLCGAVSNLAGAVFQLVALCLVSACILFLVAHAQRRRDLAGVRRRALTDVDEKSVREVLVIPFYFRFLQLAFALYILRAVLITTALIGNYSSAHFTFMRAVVIHPLGAIASEGLALFLSLNGAGQHAIRVTKVFFVVWYLFMSALGLSNWIMDNSSGAMTNYVPEANTTYWATLDGSRVAFYGVLLIYLARRSHPRRAAFVFSAFEFLVYMLSAIFDTASLRGDKTYAPCTIFCVWALWTGLYPVVTWYSLRVDSQYWQDVAAAAALKTAGDISYSARDSGNIVASTQDPVLWSKETRALMGGPYRGYTDNSSASSPLLRHMTGKDFPGAEYLVSFTELAFQERIGQGGTSLVYRGVYRDQEVAIKAFKCDLLTPEYIRKFAQELSLATRLQHSNLVRTVGMCVLPPDICLVTELCSRGTLFHVLKEFQLKATRRIKLAIDVACGLSFLHGQQPPVLHRDLKSLNLLVADDWSVKLTDFGEARELHTEANDESRSLTTQRGTPQWMAPEVFLSQNYDEKIDIYSLGVVLWEIGSSQRPFSGMSPWLVPAAVSERGERPPLDALESDLPQTYRNLVEKCWQARADLRPTASEVHSVLRGMLNALRAEQKTSGENKRPLLEVAHNTKTSTSSSSSPQDCQLVVDANGPYTSLPLVDVTVSADLTDGK